jgi:multicomponent Na+:H+ antiporter subunit D
VAFDSGAAQLMPLAVAVPILAACVVVAVGEHVRRPLVDGFATLVSAGVVGMTVALAVSASHGRVVTWTGGWRPAHHTGVGIALIADPLSATIAVVTASLMTLALLYGWRFFESVRSHFHALMLLFLAGMEGFALTGDLFDMFVFFELMGAVAYALTGFKIEDESALQGAVNFGVMNSLGAYLSLSGVGLLYARTGELGLPQLSDALHGHRPDALVVGAFVLVSCGFLVKGAMAPFHYWLADAHAVAPTPVCVLFSGIMVELGVYGVARLYWIVFSGTIPHAPVRVAFLVFGALTAVVGAVMCFAQRHLKRLLAYSTIGHVGLFLMGFGLLDTDGTAGTAVYVLGHAGAKSALFLLTGLLLNRYGTVDEIQLRGKGREARLSPWLFLVGGLALAGIPPFGTGLGKDIVEAAGIKAGYGWVPVVFVFTSAVTAGAVIRAALRVYFGVGEVPDELDQPESTSGEEDTEVDRPIGRMPALMGFAIVTLLAGSLAVGLIPGLGARSAHVADHFVDRSGYVAQALDAAPPTPAHPAEGMHWTASGLALGSLSGLLAIVLALIALYPHALPRAAGRLAAPFAPPLHVLRRLHSGHIGDYVAWLFLGLAAFAALVGLPLR